jgi:hypothetical protein
MARKKRDLSMADVAQMDEDGREALFEEAMKEGEGVFSMMFDSAWGGWWGKIRKYCGLYFAA